MLSSSTFRMVEAKDVSASEGEDAVNLAKEAANLVDKGRWRLCNDGKGLERQFKFKTFKATWVCNASHELHIFDNVWRARDSG